VPASPESYLHRIGRTGRAGRGGTAITLAEPREHRLLRAIEQFMKVKIDVAAVPTVADLRARRLDLTRASLREVLVAEHAAADLDRVRVVVESLAEEFDIVDIAAAAVKIAHAAVAGDGDDREIPAAAAPRLESGPARSARHESTTARKHETREGEGRRPERGRRESRRDSGGRVEGVVRLFVDAGRQAGIRPGDLVGAITGEAGVESRSLGAIEIADRFSLVEVPESLAENIIAALRATTIRGKKVMVRRERPQS
jgi:ATP-dependent RNA helicase DeaD